MSQNIWRGEKKRGRRRRERLEETDRPLGLSASPYFPRVTGFPPEFWILFDLAPTKVSF
jgi:hypothetical protein